MKNGPVDSVPVRNADAGVLASDRVPDYRANLVGGIARSVRSSTGPGSRLLEKNGARPLSQGGACVFHDGS